MIRDFFKTDTYMYFSQHQVRRDYIRVDASEIPSEEITTMIREDFLRIMKSCNAHWKMPSNPITSREYWERYFSDHPEQRPRHVHYYSGSDPTTGIQEFLRRNDIGRADTLEEHGPLLGFDDNHIKSMWQDPRAWEGYEWLMDTAERIIEEQYAGFSEEVITT
jgi:hypothetical protein